VADADPIRPDGMVGSAELDRRLGYHPATAETIPLYEGNRAAGIAFACHLDQTCPPGRELALALTHVQEALMWANAAVACTLAPLEDPAGRQPNPLVQQLAVQRTQPATRTLQIDVQLADGLDPHEAGRQIAEQVSAQLANRSAAEQSVPRV
jgi:hypothetical protein